MAASPHSTRTTRIDPMFNSVFIRVFGQDDSRALTRGFVNAILAHTPFLPIGEIDNISAEHTSIYGSVDCKTPRMDVRIVSANRIVDLEPQNYPEDIASRSMLYGAQLLASGTHMGDEYSEIPQVVVITLLNDEPLFPQTDDFITTCAMRWEDGHGSELARGSDRIVFVLIELQKVRKRYKMLTEDVLSDEALAWAYLLTNGYPNEREVAEIMTNFPTMEEFAEKYGYALNDPKVTQAYEDFVSAEREWGSRQRYFARKEREATERGLEKGLAEGREKGLAEGLEKGLAEGLEKGLAEGLEKGLKEGRAEGKKQARQELTEKLRALGVDESILQQALDTK